MHEPRSTNGRPAVLAASSSATGEEPLELTVVIPTFNEKDNVALLVERLHKTLAGIAWEAIFVDDDSSDGTSDIVRALAQRDRQIRVIQRIGRRGLSSACVEGALSSSAPFIAVMDADLQHDETILPAMLHKLKSDNLDIVVGSRYVEGGSTGNWDSHRLMISQFSVALAQSLFKVGLKDPMSGFFMMRREAFNGSVRNLSQQGFKILFDLMASSPSPMRFAEIPFKFGLRQHGDSKLDTMVAWQFGVLILDKLFGRYLPVRFLMFALVGGTGILVHLVALYVLLGLDVAFTVAQTGAVLVSMTSNFFLDNIITYRDQRLRGWRLVGGLLTFYAVCAIGAIANVGIASTLYMEQTVWWWAGLGGAVIGVVWNYAASRLFIWRRGLAG